MKKLLSLLTLLIVAIGTSWAATEVRFLASNKNDSGDAFANMTTSSNTTQLVGNGLAKLIAIGSANLNDAAKQIGYRSDGRLDIIFKFDGAATLDLYINANGSSNRTFELRSFTSTKTLANIATSDYSTATKVTENVSVAGAAFSGTTETTSAGKGSVSSGVVSITSSGGIKISYTSLTAGYYVFKSTGSSSSYIYGFDATVTPTCEDVAAPTNLTCSAQTSTSLTYTWTAAENASAYTATLYSDEECTTEVTSTANITTNTVTFYTLSATTTYYCKVQSNGDGETYCAEGGVTSAVSGTTADKAYTVTVASNNNEWGTAAAGAGSLDEGETTDVTATANEGYKFSSWSVEGTDASLSSNPINPTTLTIGTSDATVTATFRALETYTISYAPGTGDITGSKDDETKTEDAAFNLPSTAVFTQDGFVQTGWALTDGGEKAYELGGSYEANAAQTFYPVWTATSTLSFDANGGSGSMEGQIGFGEVKLSENLFTRSGYAFMGWATSQANATAGTVAYADMASYTITEDATLYAVWAVSCYNYTPKVVTEDEGLSVGEVVNTSTGGTMTVAAMKTTTAGSESIKFTTNGLALTGGGVDSLHVTLDSYMKAGTVIVVKMAAGATNTNARGLNLQKYASNKLSTVTMLGWPKDTSYENGELGVFSYTVVANDGLEGKRDFVLARNNSVYIKSINVVNCGEPAIVELNNVDGFNYGFAAFCAPSNFTVTDGTAYKAVVNDGKIVLKDLSGIVPANAGVVIAGDKGANATITYTTDDATADMTDNNLHGTTARTLTSELKGSAAKFMALQKSTSKFKPYNGTYFPAYKSYILLDSENAPESLEIVFDGEATAINGVAENAADAAPVKVIKNGKLYIGNYNVAGQQVK